MPLRERGALAQEGTRKPEGKVPSTGSAHSGVSVSGNSLSTPKFYPLSSGW